MRLLAILSVLLLGSPAFAADLATTPPPTRAAAYNWSGFYAGINGGYGSGGGNLTATGIGTVSGNDISGGIFGGQAGFNWQTGALVLGVEGDYQWSGQRKTTTFGIFEERTSIDSFGTLRGRVGAAVDRVLIYGTAGGAYITGHDRLNATIGGTPVELINLSLSGWGWTAGGGVEVAITENVTFKGEYLYLQASRVTGSVALPALLGGGTLTVSGTVHDHIGRAGLNFKF